MSQQSPTGSRQSLAISQATIADSQVGGQAGRDLTQNHGSGNVFKDVTINVFEPATKVISSLSRQEYRNRRALLNKVKHYWIKGVLEGALHERAFIELGLEEHPDQVNYPWNIAMEVPPTTQRLLPTEVCVADVFQQLGEGRTLLILGEPGSGKTITLLTLARDLLIRAENDVDHPIPVVFNLSSWVNEKIPIAEWLVEELNTKYQVPRKIGAALVKEQQLLPLLDGLDEVQGKLQEACVTALNEFNQHYALEMVVCSRVKVYESLSVRLNFQTALYLRSLSLAQIRQHLQKPGSSFQELLAIIEQDVGFQELAKSPLMLGIMTLAYQGMNVTDLPKAHRLEERRQQLFNAYIERMFRHRVSHQRYSKAQIVQWLGWLARRMTQQSQSVFLIEGMQPAWLMTGSQRLVYQILVRFWVAAIAIFHLSLIAGHKPDPIQPIFDLGDSLIGLAWGLLAGCVYALLGGMISQLRFSLLSRGLEGIILGLSFGLAVWLGVPDWGMRGGMAIALIYGMVGTIIHAPLQKEIESADIVRWSWRRAVEKSGSTLLIGISLALGVNLEPMNSLVLALMIGIVFGFETSSEVDCSTVPNQGIRRSLTNTATLFLVVGLLTGVLCAFTESPVAGVVNGLSLGLVSGLLGGRGSAIACIKHGVLRLLLWWRHAIPWNYARFLDDASDRIFLQKVGGGYVFMHRLFMEHFATLPLSRDLGAPR